MRKIYVLVLAVILFSFKTFDTSTYALSGGPFTQNWTTTTLITANDNWTGVSSIQGFLGQDITTSTGIDPQTLLTGASAVANDLDVIANQSNTNITNGGVAEFDGIANPTIALQGSGTADAPHIIIYLNTTGQSNVRLQYNLRDLDATADNSIQQVALQYRIGNSGNFTNVPAGYVADATTGPSIATLVTPIDVTLPAACDGQPEVQVRVISSNAAGNDEWVGIDDINISSSGSVGPLAITTASPLAGGTVGVTYSQTVLASGGTLPYSFSISAGTLPTGLTLATSGNITGTPTASGTFNFTIQVTDGAPAIATKTFVITIINAPCSPPTHTIAEIQGSGNASPFVGSTETTSGIVTGLRSNGFFMQTPDASADADPNTSEGIFVFTSSAPPVAAVIGNNVCITGTVAEFIPSTDPNSPSQTELVSPSVTVLSTGNALPVAILLTSANTNPAGGLYQLERFEGMRVQASSMTVVAPTQGNLTESAATSVSNGFFYGVISGVARPFREPGVEQPDPLPPGAPITVTRWDANPELIGVGSSSIGAAAIDAATGALLTNVVGPLDYRSRVYTIDIDPAIPPVVNNNGLTFTAVPAQTADELTVASFNIERFYDDINDPNGDAVLTTSAYNNRLNKASLAIRNVLRSPDILCIVEVEKLVVLQAIATKVNADAVAAGNPDPNYQAYLVEGNDVGGIDVGFLVKSGRVTVTNVTQYGLTTTYTDPTTGLPALLNDRPPLVLNATFAKPGCTTLNPITVIVNHLRSLNGIDDIGSTGVRVRAKRQAQAEYLANLIQGFQTTDPTANIISVGDYNAFQFSDGYVDLIGTIKGTPTPASDVVLASPDLVNPNLTDLVDTYTPAERYSYSFSGSAQVLDHVLVSSNLLSKITRFSIARVDADFPEVYRSDANRPERISDHDAPVAYILFTDNINPVITCPANIITNTSPGLCSAIVNFTVTATDNCSGVTVASVPASGSSFPKGTTTVTSTATDGAGNISTCTFTITINDIQPPTITCPANITVSNTIGQCGAIVTFAATTATDNCPGVTVTSSPASGSLFPVGTTNITSTATDASGNTATCTFTVRVNDAENPVFSSPGLFPEKLYYKFDGTGTTVPNLATAPPSGTATATLVGLTQGSTGKCGSALVGTGTVNQSLNTNWATNMTGSWTISFWLGPNQVDNNPSYLFGDITAGAFRCFYGGAALANNILLRGGSADVLITGVNPTATLITVVYNSVNTVVYKNGASPQTYPVTFTNTGAGPFRVGGYSTLASVNGRLDEFSLYSRALTPAEVLNIFNNCPANVNNCPSNITVNNTTGICGAAVTYTPPVGIDNCPGVVTTQIAGLASGSTFPIGTTTNTYRATDASGNTANCTFTVTVNDVQAPTIACPANITANTPIGSCTAVVNYTVTSSDNCSGVVVTRTAGPASGSVFPLGVTAITHLATDAAGNTSTCTFTVTVLDGQLPVIGTQPASKTVCTGTAATFSVTATNVTGYQWQQWNGTVWNNITGATTASFTTPVTTTAMNDNTYRAVLTGACTSITSGFATLTVNPLPGVLLATSSSPLLLPTQTTNLIATVSPTGGTFAWFKNGAAYTGSITSLKVEDVGTYRFVYTDPNGCVNTSGDVVVSAQVSGNFYVYPNPNVGQFSIRFNNRINETVTVSVYNSVGEKVLTKATTTSLAYSEIKIDLGARISGGIYLVELYGNDGRLIGAKTIIVGHR